MKRFLRWLRRDDWPRCICGARLPLYDPRTPAGFSGHWCAELDDITS